METILQVFLTLAFCQGVLLIIPPIVIKTTNDFWLRGATARNNPLFIWIDPHQVYYEAVLAQEVYECEARKWLYNLAKWYVSSDTSGSRIDGPGNRNCYCGEWNAIQKCKSVPTKTSLDLINEIQAV